MDLGPYGSMWLGDDRLGYLRRRYYRAGLAAAYRFAEASTDALHAAYLMSARLRSSILQENSSSLLDASSSRAPVSRDTVALLDAMGSGTLRNGLLKESSGLTDPARPAVLLLQALVVSAFMLTRAGHPTTIRQIGELRLLADEREQISTVKSMIRVVERSSAKADDGLWTSTRNEILWLHDWGHGLEDDGRGVGVVGQVERKTLETIILDALLANSSEPSLTEPTDLNLPSLTVLKDSR
jgi:hypothetical protein